MTLLWNNEHILNLDYGDVLREYTKKDWTVCIKRMSLWEFYNLMLCLKIWYFLIPTLSIIGIFFLCISFPLKYLFTCLAMLHLSCSCPDPVTSAQDSLGVACNLEHMGSAQLQHTDLVVLWHVGS